eukprot:12427289-Karenia_brevis.AAC.1
MENGQEGCGSGEYMVGMDTCVCICDVAVSKAVVCSAARCGGKPPYVDPQQFGGDISNLDGGSSG